MSYKNNEGWLRGKGNAAITGLKNGWEAVRESTFLSRVKKIASQSFNAIGDIKSKVTPKGRDIISGMRTGLNNNWSSLSGILSNIPGKVANAIPSLYTVGQNVIQTFANGFSSIHIPMPHINWDWEGGSIKIGNFKFSLPRFNLSWYANGGFPGMGEMFVARESGPELVGRMGNRSAVANNNQIIAGIRAGVFEAVVNAFESMQGRNGVTMPTPALGGLTIKKEKVWSNNTGRVANGDMVGDLIAIKYTLEITWPMLSRADAAKIDAAISPAFFNVTFTDPGSNSRITKRCYSNTPSYPVYSYVDGVKTYKGVGATLIGK